MRKFLIIIIIVFTITGFISFAFTIFNKAYFNTSFTIDPELASKFGSFFGGYVGTLFSILSVVLLIYSIINQNIENKKSESRNNFFKMLDYHNENVRQLSISHIDRNKTEKSEGRRAFVVFKLQIRGLLLLVKRINIDNSYQLEESAIIDIAYIIFFYGLDREWESFTQEKLNRYSNCVGLVKKILFEIERHPLRLGRTNQTSLSTYFRNMYNAIKLVDQNKYLTTQEKKNLIKIYRAQLSNPELYVLFFNVASRFGIKWKERKFITNYKLLKNIPAEYCEGYDPLLFFPIQEEDDDEK